MRRAVNCRGAIKVVVPHRVAAYSGHIMRESSIHNTCSGGRWNPHWPNPGIPPGRRAVPDVFDGRIVVEGQPVDPGFAMKKSASGVPNVSVVPSEMVTLRVIGGLNEPARMGGKGSGEEKGNILRKAKIPVLRAGLAFIEPGVGNFNPGREWKVSQQVQSGLLPVGRGTDRGQACLPCAQRVSVQLEFPAFISQFWGIDMATVAGVASLACKTRHSARAASR